MTVSDEQFDRSARKICLGIVLGPQGLEGVVKIKSYTAHPEDIASYGPVSNETGTRQFDIRVLRATKKGLVAELSGIDDRSAAEAIKGLELFVERNALPEPDQEEYYFSDLIGLNVEKLNGQLIGKVKSMDNFGAGDVMEVELTDGGFLLLPFTRDAVPVVDIADTRVVVKASNGIDREEFRNNGEKEL